MDPSKNPLDLSKDNPPGPPTSSSTPQRSEQDHSLLDDIIHELASPTHQTGTFGLGVLGTDDEGTTPDARRYDERDFQSHRSEHFPLIHHPLKPLGRSRRKATSTSTVQSTPTGADEAENSGKTCKSEPRKIPGGARKSEVPSTTIGDEEDGLESTPLLSQQSSSSDTRVVAAAAAQPFTFTDLVPTDSSQRKVQFEVGGAPLKPGEDETVEKKKIRPKTPKYEDPSWRLKQGSQRAPASVPLMLQGFDLLDMAEVDKDDLSSHRFQDTKAFRRHKFYLNGDSNAPPTPKGAKYDHDPHEVFVELDILTKEAHGTEKEWTETARWIKYEEDVEEGTNRWGKPHVASLSFHALINLRRLIESGVLLLDLEEKDLPGIAYRVVEQMGADDVILMEEKVVVLRNLLLKHKHLNDGSHGWKFGLKRNTGSLANLHSIFEDKLKHSATSPDHRILHRRNSTITKFNDHYGEHVGLNLGGEQREENSSQLRDSIHVALDLAKISPHGLSEEDMRWITGHEHILRRIPIGSELALVLCGVDDNMESHTVAFVRLAESVYMPNVTEVPIPVRFIFVLMGPSSDDLDYKEIGRSISTLMSNRQFHNIAYKASDRKHLLRGIHDFLDASIVIPPGDWNWDDNCFPFQDLMEKSKQILERKQKKSTAYDSGDGKAPLSPEKVVEVNPFVRTKRLFGGLRNDIRKRYPLYLSDLKDGFDSQCLATIIFLYFAAVSGAIGFGGLMAVKTDQFIGLTETVIGSGIGGIMMSLLSGQPLLIVGSTATTLVFDESLFQFCKDQGLTGNDFLAIRTWIGLWMVVIGLVVVAFDGSVIVRFFSRFTQEIYATLISFVFIFESFKSLGKVFKSHRLMKTYGRCTNDSSYLTFDNSTAFTPEPDDARPNVALLSLILMLGTFLIAHMLKLVRTTTFFTNTLRKTIANFAVLFAIGFMGLLDYILKDTQTDKLNLPDLSQGLHPSNPERNGWLVDPIGQLPLYWVAAAAIPALLLFILVFMETSIAELIVGKKELRLRKGSGFHLDVLLMCFVNLVMGYLGTCWISAASVRCVTHTVALTVFSSNDPPGQKPSIIGVKEQRVTSFMVSLLVGLSILMANVLVYIPMAVLLGVFLFMGVSSMAGVQFLERISLFFKQSVNHPQVPFVRRVRTIKMHLFTIIQVLCLGFLWGIKESPAALSLPLMIFLLVPFRYFGLPFWFKPLELAALDADGVEICDPKEMTFSVDEGAEAEAQAYDNSKSQGMNGKPDLPIRNGKVPLHT